MGPATKAKSKVSTTTVMLLIGAVAAAAAIGIASRDYFKNPLQNVNPIPYKPYVTGGTGYNLGYNAGYNSGYNAGYNAGYVPGYYKK